MKIAVGCDHGGFILKSEIVKHLTDKGIEVIEMGCMDGASIDYPIVAKEVCAEVTAKNVDYAILICGTGIGISIAANKIDGIRAALCTDCYMAKYTRLHNNANVLCMGGRVIGAGLALEIVDAFLSNEFEGGRHQRRIDLITALENE